MKPTRITPNGLFYPANHGWAGKADQVDEDAHGPCNSPFGLYGDTADRRMIESLRTANDGAGGQVRMWPDASIANDSLTKVVAFFSTVLAPEVSK